MASNRRHPANGQRLINWLFSFYIIEEKVKAFPLIREISLLFHQKKRIKKKESVREREAGMKLRWRLGFAEHTNFHRVAFSDAGEKKQRTTRNEESEQRRKRLMCRE